MEYFLDRCQSCGGLWLDNGELEGILKKITRSPLSSLIQCKPRLLRRVQSRWGFPVESRSITPPGGEAAALPFGRTRGFKPRDRYNLIDRFLSPHEEVTQDQPSG